MPVSVQNNYIPSASTGDEIGYVEGFNGAMTRSSLDAVGQAVGSKSGSKLYIWFSSKITAF